MNSKRILLWIVLILLFLATYNVFTNPAPEHGAGATALDSASRETAPPIWLNAATFGFVFLVAGYMFYRARRSTQQFQVESTEGTTLLAQAEYARAESHFAQLLQKYHRQPGFVAVAKFSRGIAMARLGQLDRAAELMLEADGSKFIGINGLAGKAAANLALTHALRGDATATTHWCSEAEKRRPKSTTQPFVDAMCLVAVAITDVRAGRVDQAARALEDRWRDIDTALMGEILRPVRVIRAFIAAQSGVRGAGTADRLLDPVRPSKPGEFAWLGSAWPEMRAFLESNAL